MSKKLTEEERRERKREASRKWLKEHPDYGREYREANKDRAAEYRKINKDHRADTRRKWRLANKERAAEADRRWRESNLERCLENWRKWKASNPDRVREYNRDWRKRHGESRRVLQANRRARKLGNGGSHTKDEWLSLCGAHGNRCLRCGAYGKMTADHVVPLSRGGRNDIANIQPLCMPCNSSKNAQSTDYRLRVPDRLTSRELQH